MKQREQPVEAVGPSPRVTYILAAYNAAATLGDALDSLERQRCSDWAVIVVDDGSTDNTLEIALAYAGRDPRVRVISQSNAGPAAARNVAASEARSEFVAILDADDELADDHLSTMLGLVDAEPEFAIYSSDGYFVRDDGSCEPVFGYQDVSSVSLEQLMSDSLILGGGTLIRTNVFRALGGFRPEIYCEDYDLWLRALAAGHLHVATPERLYLYRVGLPGQKSEDKIASVSSAIAALQDLIVSGLLTDEQRRAAEAAAAKYGASLVLEHQAVRLREVVERVFGARLTPGVLAAIHSFSWLTRPVRRWVARARARSSG